MLIAATGDIHSPRYFPLFVDVMDKFLEKPDLFLIAGDIVHKGDVKEYTKVSNAFFGKIDCPIVACFGNNEFGELRDNVKTGISNIRFLEDETLTLRIAKKSVGIVGTLGSLDRPTFWQSRNIPGIADIYEKRIDRIDKLLWGLRTDIKILLIHYAPTYRILEGENPTIFPELACKKYEKVLSERKPNVVISGHAHRGLKHVWVDTVPVFNVSLPLNQNIVLIDTEKLKPGLEKFF